MFLEMEWYCPFELSLLNIDCLVVDLIVDMMAFICNAEEYVDISSISQHGRSASGDSTWIAGLFRGLEIQTQAEYCQTHSTSL